MADLTIGLVSGLILGTLRRLGILSASGVYTAGGVTVDWTSYTPTCSWSSNVTVGAEYRVVDGGETMELKFNVLCTGAPGPGGTALTFDLPAGYSARLPADGAMNNRIMASGDMFDADAGSGQLMRMLSGVSMTDANTLIIYPASETTMGAGEGAGITSTNPFTWAVNDQFNAFLRVPLA